MRRFVVAALVLLVLVPPYFLFVSFMFDAAWHRADISAMRLWITLGANINGRDVKRTPLHWAIEERNTAAAKALLALGADPNARWGEGSDATPLMEAAGEGWVDVVEALIKAGADVNAKNYRGNTALMSAQQNPYIVAILKRAGAKQ